MVFLCPVCPLCITQPYIFSLSTFSLYFPNSFALQFVSFLPLFFLYSYSNFRTLLHQSLCFSNFSYRNLALLSRYLHLLFSLRFLIFFNPVSIFLYFTFTPLPFYIHQLISHYFFSFSYPLPFYYLLFLDLISTDISFAVDGWLVWI